MKVVLYARVSSERQDIDLSISAQIKEMREYAWKNGYTVVNEFVDEAESGRCANRPAFKEMISLARLKHPPFEAILVWKLSRFARNREDSIIYKSLLRKQGIQVISIKEPFEDTPAGRLFEGIIEVMDEFYSSSLAQDVTRGMREAASRGYFSGGKPPYGYAVTKTRDGAKLRSTLSPDASTAPVVRRAFEESLSGKGLRDIARALNKDGFTTRNGKKWSSTAIHVMLMNEAYCGTLVWGQRGVGAPVRVENAWPAIVDRETYLRVQAGLRSRAPGIVHPRRSVSEYLLSGMLRCAVCGKAMSGHSAKSGQFFYYRCTNATKRGAEECPSHWIPKSKIECFVIDRIRNCLLTEENLIDILRLTEEEFNRDSITQKEQVSTLERQTQDTESRLEHLYDVLERGSLTSDELAPRIRQLQGRLRDLAVAKEEAEAASRLSVFEMPDISTVQGYVDSLNEVLGSSPIFEQRAFLRSFLKEIAVDKEKMTIHYLLPMPPNNLTEDVVGVLPFVHRGRPCGTRTHDTLIKRYKPFVPPGAAQ
ncbi:recombinase family protein [Chloroflexota bacterium]